jgi:D-sedoheptulose 7-phosphate isomerase
LNFNKEAAMDFYGDLTRRYPDLANCLPDVQRATDALIHTYRQGGKLLVCGNGGSAADSEHIVGELMKGYWLPRPVSAELRQKLMNAWPDQGQTLADHLQGALPAISLVSHTALMTAFNNDVDPAMVFAQQVFGYGRPGDLLLGLSTSGNSRNVLNALRVARVLGLVTVGLTGRDGGAMSSICDITIRVPYDQTPEIQERHLAVYHTICGQVEAAFFA